MRTPVAVLVLCLSAMGVALMGQQSGRIVSVGPPPIGPFSAAVNAGGLIYVSGTLATDDDGRIVGRTAGEQTTAILGRIGATLEAAGSSLARAASVMVYLRRADDFADMNEAYRRAWPSEPPARTTVVSDLVLPDALVEISLVAVAPGAERVVVHPEGWLRSPNPYSYAVKTGETLFLSGLVARDARDNSPIDGDVTAQLDAIMTNATQILRAADLTLSDVVSAKVYLPNMADFQSMNDAYRGRFPTRPPARATVYAALANPRHRVEVTMTAVAGAKEAVSGDGRTNPNLSQAIRAGNRLFVSGMLGVTEATTGDIGAQTREALTRIDRTLRAGGFSRHDVVDGVVYLTDLSRYAGMNEVYRTFFGKAFPARATVGTGLVNPEGLVEIMFTAVREP